jgi:NAD(P)-dependent dehydrogenase (short-subunit alcohol dehydrogenase family)
MRKIGELMDLTGRRALVTGGAGHIGQVAAETLIELGAKVGILDRDAESCQASVDALGPMSYPLPCDLSDEAATRAAVRQAVDVMDGMDILIHCAAFVGTGQMPGWAVPFEKQSVAAWDAAWRVNATAAFVLAQEARESLSVSQRGSIIFFSSIYGMVGPDMSLYEGTEMSNPTGYGASKGALLQLTRYLSSLFAPTVRVNAISPGGVWRGQPESFRVRYEARTPLKRMAVEEDLKGAVAYLAGDMSSYVTGHDLVVDGGWTAL